MLQTYLHVCMHVYIYIYICRLNFSNWKYAWDEKFNGQIKDRFYIRMNKFYGKSSMLKDINRNKLQKQFSSYCFSLLIWMKKKQMWSKTFIVHYIEGIKGQPLVFWNIVFYDSLVNLSLKGYEKLLSEDLLIWQLWTENSNYCFGISRP